MRNTQFYKNEKEMRWGHYMHGMEREHQIHLACKDLQMSVKTTRFFQEIDRNYLAS